MEMLICKIHDENIIMYKTPKEVAKDICFNESDESNLLRKCVICKVKEVQFSSFEPEKDVKYKMWIFEKTHFSCKMLKKS